MREPLDYYSSRIDSIQTQLAIRQRISNRIAVARGILAIAAAGSIYLGISNASIFILTFLCVSAFLMLVKKSSVIVREMEELNILLQLNHHEVSFIQGDKSVFDTGADVNVHDHLFALDLDIFGKGSLFQSINRTSTQGGRGELINTLLYPPDNLTDIKERKENIQELVEQVEYRQLFYSLGKLSGETDRDMIELDQWTTRKDFYQERKTWLWTAGLLASASFALLSLMIVNFTFYPIPFVILFVVNSSVLYPFSKETKKYFNAFGRRTQFFGKIGGMFSLVGAQQFTSKACCQHAALAREASLAFARIAKIANAADQRLNGFTGPLLNIFFFFDIWSIYRIEEWRKNHQDELGVWLSSMFQMDMLHSFANFSFNHPHFSKAVVGNKPGHITATQLGHPLLQEAIAVKNDYTLGATTHAHIITGSNMAGKSTFIRSAGVNVVLALNGAPVCAKTFECSIMQVISCIRITDSLEENASYFKAELTRLEQLVNVLRQGKPSLVLLDEILRGTNSDDKRHGTMAFYKKLKSYDCIAMLATHDLNVGQLQQEDPDYFENFCFESAESQGELVFDYKLRKGISTSANASFLMKRMGLID